MLFVQTRLPLLSSSVRVLLLSIWVLNSFQGFICLGHIPLLHLPNWSFSYALALFREGHESEARKQLMDAFLYFPQIYLKMKEKMKV